MSKARKPAAAEAPTDTETVDATQTESAEVQTSAQSADTKPEDKTPEEEPMTLKVRRTANGPHPLHTLDREWEKAGDEGEMSIAEALNRIEHGFFEPMDKDAHAAAVEKRMAALRAADDTRIAEQTTQKK
jgi:hypothetical protein